MSADTSDPALAAAAAALFNNADPAVWLVAGYAPGTTAIVLRATGGKPRFPGMREAIQATQDVAFAYVVVRGKGLVVIVLNGVGGVKRAKAIVHARAFAAIFPDYLALATLPVADDLTDDLIAERLGLPVNEVVEAEESTTITDAPEPPSPVPPPQSIPPSTSAVGAPFLPSSPTPPPPPPKSPDAPSSSSSTTPGPSSQVHVRERDMPELPDDPTTPRAAVHPPMTSAGAPVPQRPPRKRSASPTVSNGLEKATPARHSHSQPTSPYIPASEVMPNMVSQATSVPPTPPTPMTPVTPKAPIDPSAPQSLYQGIKPARAEVPEDATEHIVVSPEHPNEEASAVPVAKRTAGGAAGIAAAAATVLGVGSLATSPITTNATSQSSPGPSLNTPSSGPSSGALSSMSDSPRQRSVSNSSARLGSDTSSTRPLSRDSGYWGGRPPSRDASVPTSVTSDSRRSSRRGSDPSFSPTMLSRMSMYAPPVPPVPHELRRASREPLRGDPEPLRVASVPHSPMSSPLINSPHSHSPRGSGNRNHFMPAPLPVPDHSPPAVPAIPNPLPNPSSSPLAPSSAVASPPIPQRSRQRSIGTRALPPPSPAPDHPPPPVPNMPPSKLPVRPRRASRRLSSNASPGPSPDLGGGGFTSPPLPPVPAAVREASLAIQDSGPSSLMSSPLVNSPPSSPRVSAELVSPISASSRIGSGAFFSARSSVPGGHQSTGDSGSRHNSTRESSRYESTRDSIPYDSGRDSIRQDSARNSSNRFDPAREPRSSKDDLERPVSTMLPYAQPEPADEKENLPSPGPHTGVLTSASGATAGLVGLGFSSAADLSTPERSVPLPESQDTLPLSSTTASGNKMLLSPNVMASVTAADTPSRGSPASSVRSGGSPVPPARLHKKSNSISRKPVPKVDAKLLDTPELVTKTPVRKSSLRRLVDTNISPNTSPQCAQPAQLTRSLSVGGSATAPVTPSPRHLGRSPSLGGKTELLAGPDSPNALVGPPSRDAPRTAMPHVSSSPVPRTTTPRLSPSPAFGTPPTATKALPVDGGMPQVLASSVSPKPSSQSGSSAQSSPRIRSSSSLRSNRSPRMVSPAHLERAKTLAKARKEREAGYEEGDREVLTRATMERTVPGVDLSAVGSDVVGLPPNAVGNSFTNDTPERPWRPQTPQRDATFYDAASPRSILSSPRSGEGLEDGIEAIASAQVVKATPAHARVMSISNGLVQDVSPESVGSDSSNRSRPFSSPPASPSRTRSTRSSDAARSKAASADGHVMEPAPRGLGFGFLRDDTDNGVERITTEDSPVLDAQETLPQALPSLSPSSNLNAVELNSAGNTPVPAVSTTMPSPAEPASMTVESSAIHARDLPSVPIQTTSYLTPTHGAVTSVPSPGQLATPPSPRVVRRSPSKFRLFRSPRVAPEEEDMSPPLTPTSQRLRTQSITNAFRLRRNTNSHTPPGSPPVRNSIVSSNSTSEDHATLPYEYGLQGLGLANFPLAPSAYRTPSGGIGYTPAKMERKLSLTAQEAFASARERQAQEQAQALEAFRNSEKARTMSRGSSANPHSRVVSMAMSSEFMSDDSHYDNASDELPQSLSLAMVTAAGSEKIVSPVEQLSAAASAARQHRQDAKDSPTSPTAGDEGAEARQRARESALADQRDDEFHDALSDLASDELELVDEDDSMERFEQERLEHEQAQRDAREAQLIEAERLRADELHAQQTEREAERARLSEAERVRQEHEALEAEHAAEMRRLEKERLRLEAARMEEEAAEMLSEENRIAEYARAEEEERRAQAEREAEADRLAQEAKLAEMEARLEADRRRAEEEEAAAAAKREADRQEAERLEAERLAAERVEAEEAEAAAAKAEADRRARETRKREEVTRQLKSGKADGGIMLRGWVTVQTMNSPTWRRRYFHLFATELRLFKSDSEVDTAKPLTTVPLDKAKVSEAYEESAVQGSWKLNAGGKEFYMFADTPDDRQTVLQGLNIAIGA